MNHDSLPLFFSENDLFENERFRRVLARRPARRYVDYNGFFYDPIDLMEIESIRRKIVESIGPQPSMPVDIFLLSLGESPRRDITKIGGVPFRPRSKPWPLTAKHDEPYTFLAQFRFVESRDLFPKLPGEILLIFGYERTPRPYRDDSLVFEWYSADEQDLIDAASMPRPGWDLCQAFGHLYRTREYEVESPFFDACQDYVDSDEGLRDFVAQAAIARLRCLKIGGRPSWGSGSRDEYETQRRHLCTLPRALPKHSEAFPYVNREEPYALDRAGMKQAERDSFWCPDVDAIYLFLDQRGNIAWEVEIAV